MLTDVGMLMERIVDECNSAKERERIHGGGGGRLRDADLEGNQAGEIRPIHVIVEDDTLALNLSSPGNEIAPLQRLVERVAYSGCNGYSFPSVRRELPKPHLYAVATLEAIRRGADLRGSCCEPAVMARRLAQGDPGRRRPFVKFRDALSLFVEISAEQNLSCSVANIFEEYAEKEDVFIRAVRLYEAQGAILLTRVDGGVGQNQQGSDTDDVPFAAGLVVHVDPAWFADLVRRIVDVRLLEPLQQETVMNGLKNFAKRGSMLALSTQHRRFIQAGEVSKNYLQFLWLKDMDLGPASMKALPLNLAPEDINAMVDSLLDVRFMFRVRDDKGLGVVPDRYVIASCLPGHLGGDIDPRTMLELEVGGALFSKVLEIYGAQSMPPGLIPRLLAWCGRGEGRIKACWKQGCCFAFRRHLVLLYERRGAAGGSSIECFAKGSAHNESAEAVLSEVVEELGRLVTDARYGFPGVDLFEAEEGRRETISSEHELEKVLVDLEWRLEDHMNVKFDELARNAGNIAGVREMAYVVLAAGVFTTCRYKHIYQCLLVRKKNKTATF